MYCSPNLCRRYWWCWLSELRPNESRAKDVCCPCRLEHAKMVALIVVPWNLPSRFLSFDHTMKQFQLRKGFTIFFGRSVAYIFWLATTLCCSLMMKNFPSFISSQFVGLSSMLGITHSVYFIDGFGIWQRKYNVLFIPCSSYSRIVQFFGARYIWFMEMENFLSTLKTKQSQYSDQNLHSLVLLSSVFPQVQVLTESL